MINKRANKYYEEYQICRVYDKVLAGVYKTFAPNYFEVHRTKKIKTIVAYLIEDIMQIEPQQALTELTYDKVKRYKIQCLLKYIEAEKPAEETSNKKYVKHLVYYTYPYLPKETLQERVIECYKKVLSGERKNFPKNYFRNCLGEDRAKICFEYLCQKILFINKSDLYNVFLKDKQQGLKLIKKYKLYILVQILYYSVEDMIFSFYPDLTQS